MKKKLLWSTALLGALVLTGVAFAQRPVVSIEDKRHPHLAASQRHLVAAWEEAEAARTANHEELGGHAEKAIELLAQADRELKEAAKYSDEHHR